MMIIYNSVKPDLSSHFFYTYSEASHLIYRNISLLHVLEKIMFFILIMKNKLLFFKILYSYTLFLLLEQLSFLSPLHNILLCTLNFSKSKSLPSWKKSYSFY